MNQLQASGIILRRTDYGEADRILTFLTPEHGRIRTIAKGVRKQKSKMAGGIELFSISELHFIKGKGDIDTLTSTRLQKHFGNIVKELERTNVGYDCLKLIQRTTEDNCEPEYFELLSSVLGALDDLTIVPSLTQAWFYIRLLMLAGHQPELGTDSSGQALEAGKSYVFDFEAGSFRAVQGDYGVASGVIKLLRLCTQVSPAKLAKVQGLDAILPAANQLLHQMTDYYLQSHQG
jgi:DNA repair protein RecO (recombination protein O)